MDISWSLFFQTDYRLTAKGWGVELEISFLIECAWGDIRGVNKLNHPALSK